MGESTLTITWGILARNMFFYKGAGVCLSALNDGAIGDERAFAQGNSWRKRVELSE